MESHQRQKNNQRLEHSSRQTTIFNKLVFISFSIGIPLAIFFGTFQYSTGQDIIFNGESRHNSRPYSRPFSRPPRPPQAYYQNDNYNNNKFNDRRSTQGFGIQLPFVGNINVNDALRNPLETLSNGFQNFVNGIATYSGHHNHGNRRPNGNHENYPNNNGGFSNYGSFSTQRPPTPPLESHQSFIQEKPKPSFSSSSCRSYYNTQGYCTNLDQCPSLQRLIKNRPRSQVNRILRGSTCGSGFSTICCPEPVSSGSDNLEPAQSGSSWGITSTLAPPLPPPIQITTQRVVPFTQDPILDADIRTGCGHSSATHPRIVGGREAAIGAWPWIAALGYTGNDGKLNFLCGGALVSPNHIVTAAHCVQGRNDLTTIRLGDHDLTSDADGTQPVNLRIAQSIVHPSYNPSTFQNDLAVIRLSSPISPYTKQIHPICLPTTTELRSNLFENMTPFVAGWGSIQFNGPSSPTLREVQLPVIPVSDCKERYKLFRNIHVDEKSICAGLARGGKDSCQGDSGGPLMQPISSDKYVLIGVVSFGYRCAEPGYPGVYTRISSHVDWILDTIRRN